MKYTLYILIILLSLYITIQASADDIPLSGQAKIDSLLAELPNAKGDTNEVKLLSRLSLTYSSIDINKGMEYGYKGLKLANEIEWKKGQAKCYNSLGANTFYKSDFNKTIEYNLKSLEIFKEYNDTKGITANLGNLGSAYLYKSNYPKALEYFLKALKINEEAGDNKGAGGNMGSIGHIYLSQKKYEKALEYFRKAMESYRNANDLNGVAMYHTNMGIVYFKQSKYIEAEKKYRMSLKINEKLGNQKSIANNLGNLGLICAEQDSYSMALSFLSRALKINKDLGDKYNTAIYTLNIGKLFLSLSQDSVSINPDELNKYVSLNKEVNLNKSIDHTLEAINLFEEIGELDSRSQALKNLAEAYKLKGEHENRADALEEYHDLKDSIYSQENADKIAALEKAREDDLKQKEIEKQKLKIAEQKKREKLILYFSIGFIIVMAVVMFVIYRLLKRSDKLLYNVLPVSIAKRLKNKEHPISDYFTQASIVFIDIVNFTEMAKDEDPRKLVEALNAIFTSYDTIANKYGLEKIKTIGDSYMAAAGIPEVQKDNTHRAAQMAIEVKQLMSDYHTADGIKIEVRIGLDCGPVVAGVIGENKFIYDMWSDAVNTASRMETSSEAGQVHITDRFKEVVSEYEEFEYVERGEIEIKGKGMMKTYYIESKEVVNV